MLRPAAPTVLRACLAKRLDPATAWAVVTGPPERPNLIGVRATENEVNSLARLWRTRVTFIQVTTVAELLGDPTLRRVLNALASAERGVAK